MLKALLSRLNNKSIMLRWLLSYFVLIVIFMFSTGISIGYFYRTFKTETLRTNEYIMDVVAEEFNSIYLRTGDIVYGVTDNSMRRMIVNDLEDDANEEYTYYLIQSSLKMLVGNDNEFEQCFIYLEDRDMIISTRSVLNSKEYYDVYFKNCGISYNAWKKSISTDTHNSFVSTGNSKKDKFMLVNKNAFSIIYRQNTVSLAFVLDRASLDDMNQRIYDTSGAYIVMEDNRGNFVNFSSNKKLDNIKKENIFEKNNLTQLKTDEGDCIVLKERISGSNNLMLVIPKWIFNSKLTGILIMQILVLLLVIVVSVVLAFVFSKIHFSPVKEMLSALNAKKLTGKGDEYKVISDIITEVQSENKNLDTTVVRQTERLRNNFIRSLLRGEADALANANENFRNYNIPFVHENYAVLIFEIADYDDSWMHFSNNTVDYDALRFAIENMANELIGQKYSCCTVNMFDGVVCIANLPSDISDEDFRKDVSEMYMYLKKFTFEKLGFSFRMVGGSIKKSVSDIKLSYTEAVSCLEYNMVYDKKIMFMDNSEIHSFRELNAFFGKTARLVKLMRQATESDIEPAVDEWTKMYVSLSPVFPDIMQYEFSGLINSILRDVFSQNSDSVDAKEFAEKITSQYKPEARIGYNEIKETLIALSADIKDFVSGNGNGVDYLERRVMSYIENNYADTNLNVAKIAEGLKMNPTYLSSAFKKAANVGVLERLNKFRCEKSTVLLSETDRNINEIALSVGYSSVHTYIRIFKKLFFMTPTQYRSEIRRGKNE